MGEDEIVGWHHQLNGHEFEQTLEDTEWQGNLACCSPRGHRVRRDSQLNNNRHKRCQQVVCRNMTYK